jgi:hypothetical protein
MLNRDKSRFEKSKNTLGYRNIKCGMPGISSFSNNDFILEKWLS